MSFVGIEATIALQARAADPGLSAFVSANAGSGKTHVLTERVVRLLLSGTDPARILCLTYTKAAAAEMAERVFHRLAAWAVMDDDALAAEIGRLDGEAPDGARLASARRLFAEALETPGGLKIQTLHAFCEAILHQFPLEANVPGHFEVMDEAEAQTLLGEARRRLVTGAAQAAAGEDAARPVAEAFATALSLGGEKGLDDLIGEIVARRDGLSRFLAEAGGPEGAADRLKRALGAPASQAEAFAVPDPAPGFDPAFCRDLAEAASASKAKRDAELTGRLQALAEAADEAARLAALRTICLKKSDGEPYAPGSVATKAVAGRFPDFAERLAGEVARLQEVEERLATLRLLQASEAALILADALQADYARLKRRRGRLDFEDLVVATADLLTRGEAAAWVHYKLDRGIDHVLVDEAQDTSPRQWQILQALTDEFFAGAGARNLPRTLFAVGDEKQSIYSFQGASPGMFAAVSRAVGERARAAGRPFAPLAMTQSFRTAAPVLEGIDRVFSDPANREGLTASGEIPAHQTARGEAPGLIEVWPPFVKEASREPEDWTRAVDEIPAQAPAARLAARIAETIEDWMGGAIPGKGGERRLSPDDFLILVRKRSGFVGAMTAALRDAEIPVAGADRLVITDHIAVKDLMALGRAVANVEDDLSLAEALKSPFLGFSDDELMGLALSREEHEPLSLGLRRLAGEEGPSRLPDFVPDGEPAARLLAKARAAEERLDGLRARTGFQTPFAFYARLLGPEGGRALLTARLGRDAGEVIDAFLDEALLAEEEGDPGLDAFLARLAAAPREIKRQLDKGRGEVRIMTAHASKGLEAPVVFLVDPGSAPFTASHGAKLMAWEAMPGLVSGAAPGFLWSPGKETANAVVASLKEEEKRRGEEEYRRLLYVGMTRAADRLVLCGHAGTRGPDANSWLSRVRETLGADARCREITDAAGEVLAVRFGDDPAPAGPLPAEAGEPAAAAAGPDSGIDLSRLPAEELPPRPLTPSTLGEGAEIAEADGPMPETGEASEAPPPFVSPVLGAAAEPGLAIRRGLAVHRLLEVLPERPAEARAAEGASYLGAVMADRSGPEREALLASVLAVLEAPAFAAIFSPESRAEVAIRGPITLAGRTFEVSGILDRLAVTEEEVLIVDYKTNRPPPRTLKEVPPAYILQLALYRALLAPLYPGRRLAAALLFTETPHLLPVPGEAMDAALAAREKRGLAAHKTGAEAGTGPA